jgi:drug/metabolite transporter (DMT)-like permease
VLAAAVSWSAGGLGVKLVHAPGLSVAGFRSAFAALVLGGSFAMGALRAGRSPAHDAQRLLRRPLLWGAALGYASMLVCFVTAAKLTTAANAIFLQYTGPIYVAALSWVLLRERMGVGDWSAIGGCLVGMGLFFGDGVSEEHRLGDFLAVLSSFGFASLPLQLRLLQKRISAEESESSTLVPLVAPFAMFLGNVLAALACLPWMLASPPADLASWYVVGLLGLFQIGMAYVFYGVGVRHLRAIESTLLCTVEPILSPLWVYLGTGERPASRALLGGTVIILSVTIQGVLAARLRDAGNQETSPA